jgi:hypothetical protein
MVQERPVRVERRLSAILAADVAGYSRGPAFCSSFVLRPGPRFIALLSGAAVKGDAVIEKRLALYRGEHSGTLV